MKKDRKLFKLAIIIFGVVSAPWASAAYEAVVLEEVTVTAQKREENILDVPVSISVLSGESLNSKFSSGDTILALAGTVPGLNVESSNGRHQPRFYLRGLGNADFAGFATQPVSYVYADVPLELPQLKTFPVFDLAGVEVIRGPQGTLFGRNSTAGIVKVNVVRPSEETTGFLKLSAANFGILNTEGAVGGTLIDGDLSITTQFFEYFESQYF